MPRGWLAAEVRATTGVTLAGLIVLLGPVVLAGCSDDAGGASEASPTAPVPVPEGVELTEAGSAVEVGEPAVASHVIGSQRASVVEVTVSGIDRGKGRDFVGYELDKATAESTPWYVDVQMNALATRGPGPATIPVFGFDSTDTFFPAAEVPSTFEPCPPPNAEPLGKGERVRGCLVFSVPPKARFDAVQLRAQDGVDPISWPVPKG